MKKNKKTCKKLASPKDKGTGFEREIVKQFQRHQLEAKRAWGSNGEAMGEHKEVDVLVKYDKPNQLGILHQRAIRLQCKRKGKLPAYLGLTEHVDAAVFREDHGQSYILLRLEDFILRYLS